ncbi:hypothetical protein [Spirosoma endbachense]|uniref:Uncharacterized protein n=1 Tax=Spirosoma endbachense TaxID=2666025 RepID=A0A6P1W3D3_9BACT|nr:hypothetical protein [Spirosoma endbachense]QHV99933.1 hypothetical protein GJR95_35150 [Spirosoma endbachense]
MKTLIMCLLLGIGTVAMAKDPSSSQVRTRISDDSQTIAIQIDGFKHGRKIRFDQTFDVSGINVLQKELLIYRAFDSQGLLPPLHMMKWLIFAALGLTGVILTLILVIIQRMKFRLKVS